MSKRMSPSRRRKNVIDRQKYLPRFEPLEARQMLATIQLLHASDLEGGVEAIEDAPNFAAVVEALEADAANVGLPSVLLSAGDNYISGPFFSAADNAAAMQPVFRSAYDELFGLTPGSLSNLREAPGRADITIMNILGVDASALGNHEFDLGTPTIREIIGTDIRGSQLSDVRWLGSQFPYLSSNLNFSADSSLSGLYADPDAVGILENTEFASLPNDLGAAAAAPKLAPATIIDIGGGEYVGVVGATTPLLERISSPGDTSVKDPGAGTNDMQALADILNPVIADVRSTLSALGATDDIVVLVTHLQQLQLEQELIPLLHGVDISIAGGSDSILADGSDRLRTGDTADGVYPIMTTNADGLPAAIVSTDGQYQYVGRLVVEVTAGEGAKAGTIDPAISGAFATDDQGVTEVWNTILPGQDPFDAGTKGLEVQKVTDAVSGVVIAKDSVIYGETSVYLEGRRDQVRTQETNLGNMTADANLAAARDIDASVAVSIKNGGGIRASIGEIIDLGGGQYETAPPQANPLSGKQEGEVSQLDLENTMKFNNKLTLMTVTAAELRDIMEHGVAATAPGATPGQFPQVGGMAFSFDPALPPGQRIRNLVIVNDDGSVAQTVVRDGQVTGDPHRAIRLVTLNFLAGGGDGYPFAEFGSDVVDTGIGEQQALADYLTDNYSAEPFAVADTPTVLDTRIQNLSRRQDTIIERQMLTHLDTIGLGGAEITAHDPASQRLFVTGDGLSIIDISDPENMTLLATIDLTNFCACSGQITSVAVHDGIVAVPRQPKPARIPGTCCSSRRTER